LDKDKDLNDIITLWCTYRKITTFLVLSTDPLKTPVVMKKLRTLSLAAAFIMASSLTLEVNDADNRFA
jgi:hypothetical protein